MCAQSLYTHVLYNAARYSFHNLLSYLQKNYNISDDVYCSGREGKDIKDISSIFIDTVL